MVPSEPLRPYVEAERAQTPSLNSWWSVPPGLAPPRTQFWSDPQTDGLQHTLRETTGVPLGPVYFISVPTLKQCSCGISPRKDCRFRKPCRFHCRDEALTMVQGFPGGTSGKEPACQCGRRKRCGFDPWVGKIPWRRKWQLTPVFLPGESHGQRSKISMQGRGLAGSLAAG